MGKSFNVSVPQFPHCKVNIVPTPWGCCEDNVSQCARAYQLLESVFFPKRLPWIQILVPHGYIWAKHKGDLTFKRFGAKYLMKSTQSDSLLGNKCLWMRQVTEVESQVTGTLVPTLWPSHRLLRSQGFWCHRRISLHPTFLWTFVRIFHHPSSSVGGGLHHLKYRGTD